MIGSARPRPMLIPMPEPHTGSERSTRFKACWLAETLRLREAMWGPLEDASEVRRVRQEGHGFSDKILLRAHYLGKREKLDQLIDTWMQGSRLALAEIGRASCRERGCQYV